MFDLSQSAALVTGASGGIGGAIARMLHRQGATVVLTGSNSERLHKLAADLQVRAHVLVADLRAADQVESLFAQAEEKTGAIDILVNNAGITRDGLIMRMKDEDWSQVIDMNLTVAFRLCRAAVKSMMRRRYGRIINIASVVGAMGNPGQTNYCATKAGLVGFSKALAGEVASRNITVNCVAPGYIATEMTGALSEEQLQRLLQHIPLGRQGAPDDVAAAVLYLASREASYTTGATLHVNGGMAMI